MDRSSDDDGQVTRPAEWQVYKASRGASPSGRLLGASNWPTPTSGAARLSPDGDGLEVDGRS